MPAFFKVDENNRIHNRGLRNRLIITSRSSLPHPEYHQLMAVNESTSESFLEHAQILSPYVSVLVS